MSEVTAISVSQKYAALRQVELGQQSLTTLLEECRDVYDPGHVIQQQTQGALCIELASKVSSPEQASTLLDEARMCIDGSVAVKEPNQHMREMQLRSRVYAAFMPRYYQAYVHRTATTLDDEAAHLNRIRSAMEPAEALFATHPAAPITLAELVAHALVARNNIVAGEVAWRSWQAMPRCMIYESRDSRHRPDWNVGMSEGDTRHTVASRRNLVRFHLSSRLRRLEGPKAGQLVVIERETGLQDPLPLVRTICTEASIPPKDEGDVHQRMLALHGMKLVRCLSRKR